MTLQPLTKARLRLVAVALAFVPLALVARIADSPWLQELIQRNWARAWERYDKTRTAD